MQADRDTTSREGLLEVFWRFCPPRGSLEVRLPSWERLRAQRQALRFFFPRKQVSGKLLSLRNRSHLRGRVSRGSPSLEIIHAMKDPIFPEAVTLQAICPYRFMNDCKVEPVPLTSAHILWNLAQCSDLELCRNALPSWVHGLSIWEPCWEGVTMSSGMTTSWYL